MNTQSSSNLVRIRRSAAVLILASALILVFTPDHAASRAGSASAAKQSTPPQEIFAAYGHLPLAFERNAGQSDSRVEFLSRGPGYALFLTRDAAVLRLLAPRIASTRKHRAGVARVPGDLAANLSRDTVLKLSFAGASAGAAAEGRDIQPGRSNYFIGNNPAEWHTHVPHYSRVRYASLYPGVDVDFYGNQGQLESDFVLAPGANPKTIALRVEGAQRLFLDGRGALVMKTAAGDLRLEKPRVYQERGGKREKVFANYVRRGSEEVGIHVGAYDPASPLIIDPVLVYSTYLGCTSNEAGIAIAVDGSGNTYITGFTTSANFPLMNAFQSTVKSTAGNAFVTKLNPTGTGLVFSTYLGGSGSTRDQGNGIAVDSSGNVYVDGFTSSSDFPITAGKAVQSLDPNSTDAAFLTKLDPTGSSLLYSTFLAGNASDFAEALAADSLGNAYLVGETFSGNFPLTNATAFQTVNKDVNAGFTAFVSRIDTTKTGTSSLVYSTYLGGSGNATDKSAGDVGVAIAVDSSGNAFVTGATGSPDFPVTSGGFQQTLKSLNGNAFVAKINTNAAGPLSLVYSTFLGGTSTLGDFGLGIALDPGLNAFVTGLADSTDFPTTTGAFQKAGSTFGKAFVSRLDPTKTGAASLIYSTYLGGSGNSSAGIGDGGEAIAADSSGNTYVTGFAGSSNFPVTAGAIETMRLSASNDAFVSKLDPTGSTLLFSTYLGGSGAFGDLGGGIAIDSASPPNAYVTGQTTSTDFQKTTGAFQTSLKGASDAFVTKLTPQTPPVFVSPSALNFGNQTIGTSSTPQTVTLTNNSGATLTITSVTVTGTNAGDFAATSGCGASLANNTSCAISVVFKPATTSAESATLSIADSDPSSPQTVGMTGTGTAPVADFTIAVAPSSATIGAGGAAMFALTLGSLNGFNSSVALKCSGNPIHSSCSISPSGATVNPSATATVTITTIQRVGAPPPPQFPSAPNQMWMWLAFAVSLALFAFAARRHSNRLAGALAVLALVMLANCARQPGTAAGTYTITLTGTSGSLQHSTTVSLVVT